MQKTKEKIQQERKQVYSKIVDAFAMKYDWLGAQAAEELLISAASWNIQKFSDPPYRYRNHVMLAWKRGFLKSTILRTMGDLFGDDLVSVIGKVSDAAMRGSVSGKSFTPPKPLQTPIVISTEFGQTDFSEELLNVFLAILEEGRTNVALNKIAQLPDTKRRNIEENYDGQIDFKEKNEFDFHCDTVFWGATYDPTKLQDDALRSRFSVVTPVKPLDYRITMAADSNPGVKKQLEQSTINQLRRFMRQEIEFPTDFRPSEKLYTKHNIEPRESRDLQSYMAARNWWGLKTTPTIMSDYIEYMKKSRKRAIMDPEDRIFELIFDNPMTYEEIMDRTGYSKAKVYQMLERLDADKAHLGEGDAEWVVWSGAGKSERENGGGGGLENL